MGYNIFCEIERICKEPTEEDKRWFPHLIGENWIEQVKNAAFNFKDEGFILQYLTPNMIRKLKMFSILDDSGKPHLEVTHISNEDGYREIRSNLAKTYDYSRRVPDIQIIEARIKGDRQLTLKHTTVDDIPLEEKEKVQVLKHLKTLWGYECKVVSDASPSRPSSETDKQLSLLSVKIIEKLFELLGSLRIEISMVISSQALDKYYNIWYD